MGHEEEPFFSSGTYDTFTEVHPEIESLQIEGELVDVVGDSLGTYYFNEDDIPPHLECENCGQRIRVARALEDAINNRQEEFEERVACPGEEYGGRSCVYGLKIQGTVSYREDPGNGDES